MRLRVNGLWYEIDAPPYATLLEVLRERLHLTGTKLGCDRGECGACTVLLAGPGGTTPAYACLSLAAACEGIDVTTIEGVGGPDGTHPIQQAFVGCDATQCGFCTPGQIMAALALLQQTPEPTEDDVRVGMSGNLCRCGTYPRIIAAVLDAAPRLQQEATRGS